MKTKMFSLSEERKKPEHVSVFNIESMERKKGNSNSGFVLFLKFRFQHLCVYHLSLMEHEVKRHPQEGWVKWWGAVSHS